MRWNKRNGNRWETDGGNGMSGMSGMSSDTSLRHNHDSQGSRRIKNSALTHPTHFFPKPNRSKQKTMSESQTAIVKTIHEEISHTGTHIVSCPNTKEAAIIDAVLVYRSNSGRTEETQLDKIAEYIEAEGLTVKYIMETHVHADHMSAQAVLKEKYPDATTVISTHIQDIQDVFKPIFNLTDEDVPTGSHWDKLVKEGDKLPLGDLTIDVMETPGHTPACTTYSIAGDCAFCGDSIFMPDMGTARCDFPNGSAEKLWDSIQKILALGDDVRLFVGHDYAPGDRETYEFECTVKDQLEKSKHVKTGTTKEEFLEFRTARDAQLSHPGLILPSLQVNIRGGELPEPESNGTRFLKIPLNTL
eukprot:TRINITY_DN875_c1_g2_i2.p1 TRINITY_DN875_c1_g2~~TRINITY_DN875_c1_g2_i2.p1  ORF type:complete len:359 (-),score=93.84 TRINITY_DN875_c1_g2_i2:37-1113(-)